jgi:trans-aconitate methyltransferase
MPTDSDRDWNLIGALDPYFGVLTEEKFKRANLDEKALAEFFASGSHDLEAVVGDIRRHLAPDFNPALCLDFGCGVGRLLIPMAQRFPRVIGVDISTAMLDEARRNCQTQQFDNVELVESDDALSRVTGKFGFIHSALVFQHIPRRRGVKIFRRLIELLEPGGVAALHFTYHWRATRIERWKCWVIREVPFAPALIDLMKGRTARLPVMEMNTYRINHLFSILQIDCGIERLHVKFIRHEQHLGVMLFFRK